MNTAEYAVIGCFLMYEEHRPMIAERLRPHHFTDHTQEIYGSLMKGYASGVSVDHVWLSENSTASAEDIKAFLKNVYRKNLDAHIETVKRSYLKREVSKLLITAASEIGDSKEPDKDIVVIQDQITKIIEQVDESEDHTFTDLIEKLKQDIVKEHKPKSIGYPYGGLNDLLGGMYHGDFIIVAARPGVGKTTFALDITRQLAKSGYNVAYFGLEIKAEQARNIIVSQMTGVSTVMLRSMNLSDVYKSKINDMGSLDGKIFLIDDCYTMSEIKIRARKLQFKHRLDLVIIDYLQLIRSDVRQESEYNKITNTSGDCKRMAMDETVGLPVLALSQLSRDKHTVRRPELDALRGSGALEQDADTVIFLHAPEGEQDPYREVLVRKSRWGRQGDFAFAMENRKFRETEFNMDIYDPQDQEDIPF